MPGSPLQSLADQFPGYAGGNQPDIGPNHTGNNDLDNPVAGGSSTEFPAEKPIYPSHTGGDQMNGGVEGQGVGATPMPEPQVDLLMLAAPGEVKKAINSGLQETMGSLPTAEQRKKSSNSIGTYENGTPEDMQRVFDRLGLKNVEDISTTYGLGKREKLADYVEVVIRPGSSAGAPTMQIIVIDGNKKRTIQEIRFGRGQK
ncbi:hypothetical protein [Comamonas endophytica]|uniref:Uncharacterized protein n=1 Tax=Comamonas endophytica TaxID=2949090 RepID=A0ABY6GHD9_9BURK|nr:MULTISPECIES: hypothetical protein [unclassified Acidovorax]MCD2513316.1 hypothetical protein [Acidovorax sp. D4N7]UYG53897.1 hypothetical protein M9799_18370 [Acidovorax sp. 5MLIR]